jgi:O-antigen ligase
LDIHDQTSRSRSGDLLLLAGAVFPVLLYLLLRYLGLMSLARLGVIALIGLSGGALLIVRPKLGAFFMVFYIYAGLRFYLPGIASAAITGVTTVAVVLEALRRDEFQVTDRLFWFSTAAFFVICVQSMIWARDYGQSFTTLGVLFKTVVLTVIVAYVIKSPEDLRALGKWIFAGGVATVLLGVVNMMLGLTAHTMIVASANMMRFSGTQINPNYAAAIMLSALPLGIFYVKHAPGSIRKIVGFAGIVVLIAGVFATLSRAAFFAFAVIILAVLLREVRSRRTGLAILLLFAIGILLSPRYYWVRVLAVVDVSSAVASDWSFYMRYTALRGAWEAFLDHPFAGVGLRNFATSLGSGSIIRIGPHNMYVSLLAELGIFGFIAYFSIQYSAFRHLLAGIRSRWPANYRWLNDLSYYMALSIISALVSGLFMDGEYHYMVWIPIANGLAVGYLLRKFGR